MTAPALSRYKFKVRVYVVGDSRHPTYEGDFQGTILEAERHLSDMWDEYTPSDGTGWRATLRKVGERHIRMTIGW